MTVSIIIPIYNAEKFLHRCLDSIICQNIYELILINDGSTDRSGKICEEYVHKDRRIKVFHQSNKGVSVARNRGLENITGDWVVFVDADDWVTTDWYETIRLNINKYIDVIDIFNFGYRFFKRNGAYTTHSPVEGKQSVLKFISNSYSLIGCSYVFRVSKIKKYNLEFSVKLKLSEDQCFVLKYLSVSRDIVTIDKALYNYYAHEESVVNSYFLTQKVTVDNLLAAKDYIEFASSFNVDKGFSLKVLVIFYEQFFTVYMTLKHKADVQKKYREIYLQIIKIFSDFKKNNYYKLAYININLSLYIRSKIRKLKITLFNVAEVH